MKKIIEEKPSGNC